MDSFCNTPFWDPDLSWNTSNPDFTRCFQATVLVWIPYGLYLLFLPYEIYKIHHSSKRAMSWSIHSIVEVAGVAVLLTASVIDLIRLIESTTSNAKPDLTFSNAEYCAGAISTVMLLILLITTVWYKKTDLNSSGAEFFFWVFLSISTLITYRSVILTTVSKAEVVDLTLLATAAIRFPVVIALLLLCCLTDSSRKEKEKSKAESSSFLSRVFFWWMIPLLYQGYKKPLREENLSNLDKHHQCNNISTKFESYWEREVLSCQRKSKASGKLVNPSITKVLFRFFSPVVLYATAIETVALAFSFGNPVFLNLIISYASNDEETWKGIMYAVLIFISTAISTVTMENVLNYYYVIGMQVKSALTAIIYKKCLKLSSEMHQDWSAGDIVNLMAVDTQRLAETCNVLYTLWQGFIQILLPIYLLWNLIGYAMITGILIMLFTIPLNVILTSILKKQQIAYMRLKDERVNLISEILNGMKILKLYAWEKPFSDQVLSIRGKEMVYLRENVFVRGAFFVTFVISPFLVALGTFTTFLLIDESNVLTPTIIFVSLALLNIMRIPMVDVPQTFSSIIQSHVSLKRINKFLQSDEINPDNVLQGKHGDKISIKIADGIFKWSTNDDSTLQDVNFEVKRHRLVAVVGAVGSGKSSLLSAVLGDMIKVNGKVTVAGDVAYVPQQAWIKYATIEDNILFYKEKDEKRYHEVVKACCLTSDLEILPAGDQTEIGEKGINLSGGQKQRVSLARAVYNDADVYLFDDSLSAVDSHVGKEIFENVIGPNGILNDKTRVLVTHGLHYLTACDYIYVLENGSITDHGTYDELLNRRSSFSELIVQYIHTDEELSELSDVELSKIQELIKETEDKLKREDALMSKHEPHAEITVAEPEYNIEEFSSRRDSFINHLSTESSMKVNPTSEMLDGTLIEDEAVAVGVTNRTVYLTYAKYTGVMCSIVIVLGVAMFHAFEIASNQWLSQWSDDAADRSNLDFRLGIYGLTGVFQILGIVICFIALAIGTSRASTKCHDSMLHNVISAPMSFFDTTPIGRILNRFSRDVSNMDITFVEEFQRVIFVFLKILGALIIITIGVPAFLLILIPVILIYFVCLVLYLSTSRQLMRLESITRSPIYTQFSETIGGASTIRAYRKQQKFIEDCFQKVDENQKCYYPYITAQRWVAAALQFIGSIIIFFTCIFVVIQRGSLSTGTIGLVVTYAITTVYSLYFCVRSVAMVEANVVSVERILEFTKIEKEADWVIPANRPSALWPENGRIEFKDYKVRYREKLPLVLKGITVDIKPQEKIGIVGRTGAGKSSLTLCLFRILEAAGGQITIDGINISSIGLHDLRSKLTIIPQDPVLFLGTLRFNLDPFNVFTDGEIWKALEQAHLKKYVDSLKQGLEHFIQEGGLNLSVGQRQLLCLVRALLRKTKILILDEATAAIDLETDTLIQHTIKKEFSECTILTIAHRLNTIMDSDRVLVLDNGFISEFAKPSKLLNQTDSIFYGMAKDAGLV